MHVAAMVPVGHGTLSRYRSEEEAIDLDLSLGKARARIKDNYIIVTVGARSPREAREYAQEVLTRFLQHLSVSLFNPITAQLLIIEDGDNQLYPPLRCVPAGRISLYDLERLRGHITEAEEYASISDDRLERALQYYEHAGVLFTRRERIADILSRHYAQLIASIYLNLWKALSCVIGDPSKDSDYQRRYKELGFDHDYFKEQIERIRTLRNQYDAAHYSLNEKDIKKLEGNFGTAEKTVKEVLQRYRQRLLKQRGSPDSGGSH
jgi:hypothetical protein